jgi:Flp pilus assembly protein TadG
MQDRARRARGEAGSTLVEFALILPVFLMIVFGVFSAGQAYSHKLAVVNAVREGARYGAALHQSSCTASSGNPNPCSGRSWAQVVQNVVVERSDNALAASQVCVALVSGTTGTVVGGSSQSSFTTRADGSSSCFNDGITDAGTRIQVSGQRTGDHITAVLVNIPVTESSNATARFEQ